EATKGLTVVGLFIKGFLNALAAPFMMIKDTTLKLIDLETMAVSAFGKLTGLYDIRHTCLSSTCQQYESCLQSGKSPDDCKSTALKQALKEATVIIPIYEQGRECASGDPESCGAIAAMAIGLVEGGLGRLSPGSLGKAAAVEATVGEAATGEA